MLVLPSLIANKTIVAHTTFCLAITNQQRPSLCQSPHRQDDIYRTISEDIYSPIYTGIP